MSRHRTARAAGLAAAAILLGGAAAVTAAPALATSSDWTTLTASGSGEQEVPAGSGEAGATTVGSFQLNRDGDLTYTVTVSGNSEEITAGHIHRGAAGVNGDVVVELDPAAINAGETATTTVDPEVAGRILDNPGNYYLNLHSPSFAPPTGVARGQLAAAAEAPEMIQTGTGGQAAERSAGPAELAVLALAVAGAFAVVVRAALALHRRHAHAES
ncbi:MAG: CHRD domain-containing protein [Kineosporiaceae bacterium]